MNKLARFVSCVLLLAACQPVGKDTPGSGASSSPPPPPPPPAPSKVVTVQGFRAPESVVHDTTRDVYLVSNVNGGPAVKDDNGFISRVKPEGVVENQMFIAGGKNGVTLNAPKGMALAGDTLWVTDIDVVRAFDATSGAPLDSVGLDSVGAVFLNDVVVTPTGAIYVTDTGIRFDDIGNVLHRGPDRVYRIGPDRTIKVVLRGDTLGWPNGIAVDPVEKRFVIVQTGGKAVLGWKPEDRAPSVIATGPGGFDGVAMAGRRILVSSWTDSTVSSYESGKEVRLITGVPSPAGIGYDARRNRVLVPIFAGNRVEIWQLP